MKLFEEPIVEVVNFAVEDIITESSDVNDGPPPLGGRIGTNCV